MDCCIGFFSWLLNFYLCLGLTKRVLIQISESSDLDMLVWILILILMQDWHSFSDHLWYRHLASAITFNCLSTEVTGWHCWALEVHTSRKKFYNYLELWLQARRHVAICNQVPNLGRYVASLDVMKFEFLIRCRWNLYNSMLNMW